MVCESAAGRLPMFHLDLYRLVSRAHIEGAGFESYLWNSRGVTVIEWFERWAGMAESIEASKPGFFRRVWIEQRENLDRWIVYEDSGL